MTATPVSSPLRVLAGAEALDELREHGLRAERVRAIVGASGGPKWLLLHGLDRVLFPWLASGARAPVHAVGSSIGTWRFACLLAKDPVAALDRFADAYIAQCYQHKPTPAEVTEEGERILTRLLGDDGAPPLVEHALFRLHIVTARFLHLGASEGRANLLGFGLAALANTLHRRALATAIERVVFDAQGDAGPFAPWQSLPTRHVPLTSENLRAALMASAAIPGVMSGVRNPPGAPAGVYRDGGVADYHFGTEIDAPDGLTLYPHFYPYLVPGWFDKSLPWRRTRGLRRVVVLTATPEYVAALPNGRIPDRKDFSLMSDAERMANWRRALDMGRSLGEAFEELLAKGRIGEIARPLT
ncbi:MAG TPA: hypothetical protein VK524_06190 [Polyangiaceae bacterium]|nr:hypothetical protein [Polyangiaceae bacterium]